MKKITIAVLFSLFFFWTASAQTTVELNAAANGQTYHMEDMSGEQVLFISSENGADQNYLDGPFDRYLIVDSATCAGEKSVSLYFDEFDIAPGDTLFIYDSPGPTTLMYASNNTMNPLLYSTVAPSPLNVSGKLAVRFKTNGDGNNGKGFRISVRCRDKCERITPVIDSVFYKVKRGVIVDSGYSRMCIQVDTNWNADSTRFKLDTERFRGMHLCYGESIIFKGHGEYTNYYGYGPADPWSMFEWGFGNGDDSSGIGLTMVPAFYRDIDCYDVTLRITDSRGCKSTIMETVRVRIAQNPIKTIYDLNPVCTTDSIIVTTGEGSNFTIGTRRIEFAKTKSRTLYCRTFLPDGKNENCPQADEDDCFLATITFDDFPSGRTVQSAKDICSLCINMEHSYQGDTRVYLKCPTQQRSVLWYGTVGQDDILTALQPEERIQGTYGGGGTYLGIPYGGVSYGDGAWDQKCGSLPGNTYCDSICNMYGEGFDYCFSKNGDYITNNETPCNTGSPQASDYFCSQDWKISFENYTFPIVPSDYGMAGQQAATGTVSNVKQPSDHDAKQHYYVPAEDFDKLVGCPLNGDWTIQVCDQFKVDNGWIFAWTLDFCGISSGGGCEYQVNIDSVIWEADSMYGDYKLGYWRGVDIDNSSPTRSVISAHDTAGIFPINIHLYDDFGCVWDTMVNYTSVWSPMPELGDTKLICDVESIKLDASDYHTPTTNQTFTWEPYGQITDTIMTRGGVGSSTLYTVEVENNEHNITCRTRDSVRVDINRQPVPNFDPGVYPMEGCEPYTIHFENTSQYGDSYLWVFGDGDSSTAKSPTHTYGTGQYNFKYYVSNNSGCNDSLIYEDLITVYSSPVARFSWEPMNPTVMHPEVTFQNLTVPQSDGNKYYWEIQYDRDNDISYHTLTDVNPTFEWETDGEDISGTYVARLIAMTSNRGPSGYIVECRDTVENRILLVNDFLQFPNVVTPNGDGVNDKFEIINLINGLGYPNNSLAIYDRWGKRVYYKENISKEEDFWDPGADNVPTGTYFWRFVGKGYLGDIQRNGVIEV